MSDKKIGIFSALLFIGVATLFVPVTTLQNSIAMAREYYPEYEENEYYEKAYDHYKNNDNKNAPIVNVEKKLFVCNNATDTPNDFECEGFREFFGDGDFISYPPGPDSGQYIPCNDEICPFIDESDFGVQIFKDVATVHDLSPEGTPVNLDKIHYTVTEDEIDQRITTSDGCSDVGFDHFKFFSTLLEDGTEVYVDICVNYVGDCEGTIYSDEVKTCTVENYLFAAAFFPPPEPEDNAEDNTQSSLQQSNNQAIQPQTSSLRDIISDRTN